MVVLAENTAREPILHQRQKRIRGYESRRHQRLDAMLRRHSLLNLRSVDPEDGSFKVAMATHSFGRALTTYEARL
jgi:hypothetical protein